MTLYTVSLYHVESAGIHSKFVSLMISRKFVKIKVRRFVARGIYDLHIIELKHVPFLETLPEGEMIELQVGSALMFWSCLDIKRPGSV